MAKNKLSVVSEGQVSRVVGASGEIYEAVKDVVVNELADTQDFDPSSISAGEAHRLAVMEATRVTAGFYRLAAILKAISTRGLYTEIHSVALGRNYKTWDEYVENELKGIAKSRKAFALVGIARFFEDELPNGHNVVERLLAANTGWSLMSELTRVITKDNVETWVQAVESRKSDKEVSQKIAEAIAEMGGVKGATVRAESEDSKSSRRTIVFPGTSYEDVIVPACEALRSGLNNPDLKEGSAISMLVQQHVSTSQMGVNPSVAAMEFAQKFEMASEGSLKIMVVDSNGHFLYGADHAEFVAKAYLDRTDGAVETKDDKQKAKKVAGKASKKKEAADSGESTEPSL